MYKITWLSVGNIETPKNISFYLGGSNERVFTNAFSFILEDNQEILPGITAMVLGGHTPGSTAFDIDGESGRTIICGDFINRYENYDKRLPPGLLDSIADWFKGLNRLEKKGGIIIPSHDPSIKEKFPSGRIITL